MIFITIVIVICISIVNIVIVIVTTIDILPYLLMLLLRTLIPIQHMHKAIIHHRAPPLRLVVISLVIELHHDIFYLSRVLIKVFYPLPVILELTTVNVLSSILPTLYELLLLLLDY